MSKELIRRLLEAQERIKDLEVQLNRQLNDCINFDGGKLTDSVMEESSRLLTTIRGRL